MTRIPSLLLLVTDRHQARRPLEEVVAEAVSSGARWIWFRDRDLEVTARRRLAFQLSEIVQRAGGQLSVGGDIKLAADTGANAVHVGTVSAVKEARLRLGPNALVGLSAHSVADATDARTAGADYVTLSPIYETVSKSGYGPALGTDVIEIAARIGIPVLALGGVTGENVLAVRKSGAAGVAIMGELMRAVRLTDAIEGILQQLKPDDESTVER